MKMVLKILPDAQTIKNKSCRKRSKRIKRIQLKEIRWPSNKSKAPRNVITSNANNYYNSYY